MAHTEHITTDHLRGLDVFRATSDATLDWLLQVGSVRHLAPRERLSTRGQHRAENYCFLLRGVMAITLEPGSPAPTPALASKRPPKEQSYLGYFEAGSCFSN